MEKNKKGQKVVWLLKAVLASYIVTGILLLTLSFLVYQFELDAQKVNLGIVATYLISTFTGGFILGKLVEHRRFLWGTISGLLYIGLLYGISYAIYREVGMQDPNTLMPILLCLAGGMVGGMMS